MTERAYTVREIEALRQAVSKKWLYGTYRLSGSGCSRSYKETEKTACVEEMVRTHMLAGHTAEDLYASERRDTDGSPEGPDPQGLDGEAATAGAEGIAQGQSHG